MPTGHVSLSPREATVPHEDRSGHVAGFEAPRDRVAIHDAPKLYDGPVSEFEIVTTAERPDLHDQFEAAFKNSWPEFIFHDAIAHPFMSAVQERFARYDVTVVHDDHVVAGGWGIPLAWDQSVEHLPSGYDDALVRTFSEFQVSPANTLSIMAAAVHPQYRGRGLSTLVLSELRRRGEHDGVPHVIAPVRPTLKSRYPLTKMADFARWRRGDGQHVDPWIRLHERMGATILGPAERSMEIAGSVEEWQSWTGMLFPQSGAYVVPDALDLVVIDCDNDLGVYVEPNLWMRHC